MANNMTWNARGKQVYGSKAPGKEEDNIAKHSFDEQEEKNVLGTGSQSEGLLNVGVAKLD